MLLMSRNFTLQQPKGNKPTPIAAHCWYPIESNPIPTMLKIKGSDEEIITINHIEVITTEYIAWTGSQYIEFHCKIITPDNIKREVYLHYNVERITWTLSTI